MTKTKKGLNGLHSLEVSITELSDLLDKKIYEAREEAWLSACEWIISLKEGEKADCQKAFEKYIKSLK